MGNESKSTNMLVGEEASYCTVDEPHPFVRNRSENPGDYPTRQIDYWVKTSCYRAASNVPFFLTAFPN